MDKSFKGVQHSSLLQPEMTTCDQSHRHKTPVESEPSFPFGHLGDICHLKDKTQSKSSHAGVIGGCFDAECNMK